jgi:protein-tyrosine-phosphatase/predicted ATP-grasp superfamily ATP-dependent carboligase
VLERFVSDRVLVLGDDAKAFLGVVRSLGRHGLEVHVAPNDFAAPALKSRFIAAVHRLPPYALGGEAWTSALRDLAARERIAMVVPTSDASLLMLLRHRDDLADVGLALPNPEAAAPFTDKAATRRLAFECGVPVCGGRPIASDDTADGLIGCFGLPLVLKPRWSWTPDLLEGKRPARIMRTQAALERALAEGLAEEWIVESFFPGSGVGLSLLARDGEILAAIQHRRLHEENETGPSTRRVTERLTSRLLAWCRDLALATRLTGVAMFEFRWNPVRDEHVLLEVNPRFWGSLQLAMAAGIDFPARLHDQLAAGTAAAAAGYDTGIVRSDLSGEYGRVVWEFDAARSWRGRLGAIRSALAFLPRLARRSAFDSWAPDDPAPFFEERRRLFARGRAAVAKRLPASALVRALRARQRVRHLATGDEGIKLLIVGNGNVCRSPFAEELLRAQVRGTGTRIDVASAGTLPVEDRAPAGTAMAAAAEFGVDLSRHRSRSVTPAALKSASAVIVFDHVTADRLRSVQPDLDAAVLRLPDLVGARDIADASGASLATLVGEFERISQSVAALAAELLHLLPIA